MQTRAAIAVIGVALLVFAAAGCEGSEPSGSEESKASAEQDGGSTAANPVPPGAPYDIDGTAWRQLRQADQFQIAEAYAADNSQLCDGAEVSSLAFAVSAALESGLALETAIAGTLADACEAGD